jgi:hypothetical protein
VTKPIHEISAIHKPTRRQARPTFRIRIMGTTRQDEKSWTIAGIARSKFITGRPGVRKTRFPEGRPSGQIPRGTFGGDLFADQ